jgi:non-ribosomal peptide synthetase component E (peptide arylation enzyme)
MAKKGLDRILGKGNWGEPKWGFGDSPEIKMSYYDRTGWLPRGKTVGEYWDRAVRMNSEGIAFVDTVEGEALSVTYQEADDMVKSLALSFIDMGIKPGDKIATVFQNSVRHSISIILEPYGYLSTYF